MSEVLDLKRLGRLIKRHWIDNRRKYVFSALTVIMLMLAVYLIYILTALHSRLEEELQASIFFVGLGAAGCLFASTIFSDLGSKSKGIAYLALPASSLEKLLTALFYCIIVFPVFYLGIFYMLNTPVLKMSNNARYNDWLEDKAYHDEQIRNGLLPETDKFDSFKAERLVNVFQHKTEDYLTGEYIASNTNGWPNIYTLLWCAFFAVQGFYLMGSALFGKYSFIKTSVLIFAIGLLFFLFFFTIYSVIPDGDGVNVDPTELRDHSDKATYYYRIPEDVLKGELFILQYVFTVVFWLIAYTRLREKEI
jgi:hypothetical protein